MRIGFAGKIGLSMESLLEATSWLSSRWEAQPTERQEVEGHKVPWVAFVPIVWDYGAVCYGGFEALKNLWYVIPPSRMCGYPGWSRQLFCLFCR